jgi:hypothetical protein
VRASTLPLEHLEPAALVDPGCLRPPLDDAELALELLAQA